MTKPKNQKEMSEHASGLEPVEKSHYCESNNQNKEVTVSHKRSLGQHPVRFGVPPMALLIAVLLCTVLQEPLSAQQPDTLKFTVNLKSRRFVPAAAISADTVRAIQSDLSRIMVDTLLARVGKVHVLVQMERIPSRFEKEDVRRYGIRFLNYIPPNTWITAISGDVSEALSRLEPFGLRWIGRLTPEFKTSAAIREDRFERYSLMPDNRAILLVQFHRTVSLDVARGIITRNGGVVNNEVRTINSLIVTIPKDNINSLASEDGVLWVEQAPAPLQETNDGVRAATSVDIVNATPYNLDGDGVTVLVFDAGLVDDAHPDFGTRVTHGEASVNWGGTILGVRDHATHVAGTLGGDGSQSVGAGGTANQWRGMAPAIDIVSYGIDWDGTGIFLYDNLTDLEANFDDALNVHNVDIATASVGTNVSANGFNCGLEGNYNATSQLIDHIVGGSLGRPVVTTWAAGNERRCPTAARCGITYNTINPPASAKNPIHVGAVYSDDNTMTDFSGWGPTDDGRLKPVVVAPGCVLPGNCPNAGVGITSTVPGGPYDQMCGTSMATPAVAGIISMMLQQYRDTYTYNTDERPLPSTMKAILIHTAEDLGNPGPDFQFGYGLVNAQAAVDMIRSGEPVIVESQINEDDEVETFAVQVPAGQAEFDVSLVWDDPPGAILAATELQNDLDLSLEAPDNTIHLPWVLDHTAGHEGDNATMDVDNLNNMEQVHVDNPDAGLWKIRVTGEDIPEPIQKYSLVSDFPLYLEDNVSVVQVIDRTGSMWHRDDSSYPTYMACAKTAAQNFIGLMQRGDEVGVVSFDDENCDNVGSKAEARFTLAEITTEMVRGNAISSVDALSSRGCTSIGAGMQLAQNGPNFLDAATLDQPHAMVLLTDGYENTDPRVSTVLPMIPDQTDIYTVALGPWSDDALMKDIANTTGGKFYMSPTILGLLSIYYQIQGDLQLGAMADLGMGTKGSGNDTRHVTVDRGTSEATFAVGWLQREGRLHLTLKDTLGGTVTSRSPNVETSSGSTYYYLRIKNPLPGDWEVHITRTDSAALEIDYTFAAFVKGVSKAWHFVPEFEDAGDCLLTKVHLYDSRTLGPITGATVKAVITSPKTYKYTLHYNYVQPTAPKWRPKSVFSRKLMTAQPATAATSGDRLPTWVATLQRHDMKSLKKTGQSIFQYETTEVMLYDDGTHGDEDAEDGVYTNCIDNTRIAGSYNIRFSISGVTASGANFKRQIVSAASINPGKVAPAKTLVRVDPSRIDVKEGSEATITIVPMDGFGNVWGPGSASRISASTTAGRLVGDIKDNGDGFYFQTIKSTGVEGTGTITVMIDDVEMESKPVVEIRPLGYRFSVSAHAGVAVPAGTFANDYDPSYSVAIDFDYHFTPQLSAVFLVGYNHFKSGAPLVDDTYWLNVSANLKYELPLFPIRPYINGGPGIYIPETGSRKFGFNAGLGRDVTLTPNWTAEFGADYHHIFMNGGEIQFVVGHAGLIFRF